MNKERLQLWVDALRSGEYEQGVNKLKNDEGKYCCLGVACEVAKLNGCDVDLNTVFADYTDELLPYEVMEWFGIEDEFTDDGGDPELALIRDTDYSNEPAWRKASHLNDEAGWVFEEIAEAIETKYNLRGA